LSQAAAVLPLLPLLPLLLLLLPLLLLPPLLLPLLPLLIVGIALQLGDGTPITPVDVELRTGTFPPNFVRELASGVKTDGSSSDAAGSTGTDAAAAAAAEVRVEDLVLATLSFGELLKRATEMQSKLKEHEQVNLELLEVSSASAAPAAPPPPPT
jgi:hypothetical protein